MRAPGWYWVKVLRPGALEEEIAWWSGSHWYLFGHAKPASDAEVAVLSERLRAPSEGDGSPQGDAT
jgi:hypothetical protein